MLLSANILQPLIDVFQSVIKFFHDSAGFSWGWSIVLLTVCVRLVLMPLTVKQFQSMRRLQLQQQEMMKFYQENNVNPFASCLPLLLQFPVFMSLYYMLRKNLRQDICPDIQTSARASYAAKHGITVAQAHGHSVACSYGGHHVPEASFLFVKDITATATGVPLIILLVLYVGTQFFSTWLMQQPGMDKNQQRMMMVLPLFFVVFIIRFPAGLMVYWITTNLWTVGQGVVMKYWMGPPPAVAVSTGAGSSASLGSGSKSPSPNGDAPARKQGFGAKLMARAAEASEGAKGQDRGEKTAKGGTGGATSKGSKAPAASAKPAAQAGSSTPPPPPRKKKKRSGRRR